MWLFKELFEYYMKRPYLCGILTIVSYLLLYRLRSFLGAIESPYASTFDSIVTLLLIIWIIVSMVPMYFGLRKALGLSKS